MTRGAEVIAVFGGRGQLGLALARCAVPAGVRLDLLGHSEVDIADRASVADYVAVARPRLIVNAAAFTNVDRAEIEPGRARKANAIGARNVAEVARANRLPLIHISTDFVFDGNQGRAYSESDSPAPINVYGTTKLEGEDAVRAVAPQHLIVRTAWLFSAHGSGFLQRIIRLAREQASLDIVADQSGSPTAADDLATAVLRAADLASSRRAEWGTYHFAGPGTASRHEFAMAIVAAQARHTGRLPAVNPVPSASVATAARRPRNTTLDSTRFARAFGVAATDWHAAVRQVVDEIYRSPTDPYRVDELHSHHS